jgi:hypothetical protein
MKVMHNPAGRVVVMEPGDERAPTAEEAARMRPTRTTPQTVGTEEIVAAPKKRKAPRRR